MGRLLPAREERLESTRARGKRAPGPRGACGGGRSGGGGGGGDGGRRRGAAGPGKAGRLTVGKDLVQPDRGVGFAFPSKTNAGAVELEKCCFVFEVSEPSTTGSDSIFGKQVLEGASSQKSEPEPLAAVPGLVTRGRPGLRSAASLLLLTLCWSLASRGRLRGSKTPTHSGPRLRQAC